MYKIDKKIKSLNGNFVKYIKEKYFFVYYVHFKRKILSRAQTVSA